MMKIASDWHIHSRNSCDEACMTVSDLIREAGDKGIRNFGLTDHLHSLFNLPDIIESRKEFLASQPSPRFHFGAEVSCMSQWELDEIASGRHDNPVYGLRSGGRPGCALALAITPDIIDEYHIEYVVGGTHWPMYVPQERDAVIRDYHRQNMFLATHPLVDIVAHPWWWMGWWRKAGGGYPAEPWFDNFGVIPKSIHDEFAAAAVQCNTAVEINAGANLTNPEYPERFVAQYLEYLAGLKSKGVRLSMGSDCHSPHYDIDLEKISGMLDNLGLADALWCLEPRTGRQEGSTHE